MYRVLLVDDEILIRNVISQSIKWLELGYVLAGTCKNGKEAVEFIKNHPVDVVLTDICMPYLDGMELTKFIFHNFNKINVIIFSGFNDFEYAKNAIRYKVKEYLIKPVTTCELSKTLISLKDQMDKKKEEDKKYETYIKNRLLIDATSFQ